MSKETEIVQYLREKYSPCAILLHGSRAVGKERSHSDWDIIMLVKNELSYKPDREEIAGEDVEWKAVRIPVPQEKILDTFHVYLQSAKVLWEENDEGTSLLTVAQQEYAKGPRMTKDEIRQYKQFMFHKVAGMEDDREDPFMFMRHQCVFFNRALGLWFEILENKYSKPNYLAKEIIQAEDPAYFAELEVLVGTGTPDAKIEAAREVCKRLFVEV